MEWAFAVSSGLVSAICIAAMLVVCRWAFNAQEETAKSGRAMLDQMADRLHPQAAFDALAVEAERKRLMDNLVPPVKVPLAAPLADESTAIGSVLKSGREAMKAKGYDPDDPEDVARWEDSLGPGPFGGSIP